MWFLILFLRSLDLFISYTMVVNFCQFPLTLSCSNLCIHLFFNTKDRIWTIFNSSVLKDSINVFLLYHTFKFTWSATDRRLVGDWSAISRGPVFNLSATSCIKSQRGPHEVADQSRISRQLVPDQSPTSRRPTAKPSCDSSATSATSAIVINFGRGEVAERLQCMSDRGFKGVVWWHPICLSKSTIVRYFVRGTANQL